MSKSSACCYHSSLSVIMSRSELGVPGDQLQYQPTTTTTSTTVKEGCYYLGVTEDRGAQRTK